MKSHMLIPTVVIGVFVLLLGFVASRGSVASLPTLAEKALRTEGGRSESELQTMRRDLNRLHQVAGALAAGQARSGVRSGEHAERKERAPSSAELDSARAAAFEAAYQRFEALEAAFRREPKDEGSTRDIRARVASSLTKREAFSRLQVKSIDCGQTLCRVEIEGGERRAHELVPDLFMSVAGLSGGTLRPPAPGASSATIVAFLAREGYRLPQ